MTQTTIDKQDSITAYEHRPEELNEAIIEQEVEGMAQKFGLTADRIRIFRPNWQKLMQSVLVVRLHLGYSRLQAQLDLQDLGLIASQQSETDKLAHHAMKKQYNLGVKLLAPKTILNRLKAVETKARRKLRAYSVVSMYGGECIPYTGFADFQAEMAECQADFWQLIGEMTADENTPQAEGTYSYQAMVREIEEEYRHIASAQYHKLQQNEPEKLQQENGQPLCEAEFCASYVAHILDLIPTPEAIRQAAYFDLDMMYLPLPQLLAEEEAAVNMRRAIASTVAHKEAEKRETMRVQEEAKRRAEWAEVRLREEAAQARERQLREMHQTLLRSAQKRAEREIDQFLADVQTRVYNLVHTVSTDVLAHIQDKGQLHPRRAHQINLMLTELRRLNFTEDPTVELMVQRVRQHMRLPSGERELGELQEIMGDLAIVSRQVLLNLEATPERNLRQFSLSNEPDVGQLDRVMARMVRDTSKAQLPLTPVNGFERVERVLGKATV